MEINSLIYASGIAASSILLVIMGVTNLKEGFRFWPPGERNLRWLTYWILASVNSLSILYFIVLDFKIAFQTVFGSLIALSGLILTLKAIKNLSLERTSGLEKNFIERGLYRYSRNPQVLGNILTLLGIAMIRPDFQMLSLLFLTAFWLVVMVYAEEKWLKEKYEGEFEEYRRRVPRFLPDL